MRNNLLEAQSDNIVIDRDKCTFCGVCVETCILDNLRLQLSPCRQACPLGVNCQGYVQLILRGREAEALAMVAEELPFPALLGRLCSAQCESACHRKVVEGQAVAIRALKRYLAEGAGAIAPPLPEKAAPSGKKVAVVGAGPAGLTAAWDLLVQGHAVTLYDAEAEPGGMLRWAIPEFRLPGAVLEAELARLTQLGVEFQGGSALGKDLSLDDLCGDFDAVILATGCARPRRLGVEGERAAGVSTALDLLKAVRRGEAPGLGGRVVVIGGGEVALDAAQTALRLGAESARLVSLEGVDDLPAGREALEAALAEGVVLDGAWGPTAILSEAGKVTGVACRRCLSVCDAQGAFLPSFDEGVTQEVPADAVILAIGQEPDPGPLAGLMEGLDPLTLATTREGVYLAGDAGGGASTIVEAMASGRRAAESVHRRLSGQHPTYGREYAGPVETEFTIDTSRGSAARRVEPESHRLAGTGDFAEIEKTLTPDQARAEAGRCYSCGAPFGKFRTCWFCLPCEVECPHDALWVEIPYLLR